MTELRDALVLRLEDENDVLRARIAELEALLLRCAPNLPLEWGLTPSEQLVFAALASREQLSKDQIMAVVYRNVGRDEPYQKIVDVFICKLRRKLKPFGVVITTVWGQGYRLDPDARRRYGQDKSEDARAA